MKNKGITLIALVITIIVLLILAGVTISTLTGQNGLLKRADDARNKTNYETALEIVKLKIVEVNTKSYQENNRPATLDEIKSYFADGNEIDILVKKYYSSASEKSNINQITGTLKGMEVQAEEYEQYVFLIGETCSIESVSIDDGKNFIEIDKFDPVNNTEKDEPEYIENENGRTYLYKNGKELSTLNSGWTDIDYLGRNGYTKLNSLKNSSNIELNASEEHTESLIGTISKINLGEYTKICMNVTVLQQARAIYLVASEDKNIDADSDRNSIEQLNVEPGNYTYELDVIEVSTENYIVVVNRSVNGLHGIVQVNQIWLEK